MSAAAVPPGRVGETRGASSPLYHLLTPENRMFSRLPQLASEARSTLLVSPRGRRCEFSEAIVTTDESSRSSPVPEGHEHFLYLLSGGLIVDGGGGTLSLAGPGAYAYVTHDQEFTLGLDPATSFLWIRRRYQPLSGETTPASFASSRTEVRGAPLGPPGVHVRELLPVTNLAFDFAVNLLSFEPGAALDMVEIHDEDHGLYLLTGQGTYLLDRERFAVSADDFIYMAPYCPQHFVATGSAPAEYLLYKPANRFP